jgi:hypothetical protein
MRGLIALDTLGLSLISQEVGDSASAAMFIAVLSPFSVVCFSIQSTPHKHFNVAGG